ncbi:MAG TPA: hypothetical protein VGO95_09505 [Modestobacter sp.]|jgi:hypothetical protein|nr:hypothetical protein [Modestobacter sp.]
MTSSTTPDPAGRRARPQPAPDPLMMTPAEKAIAEWEARHDVAARGSRATPGAIQLYLAESRSRERCDEAARPRPEARRSVPAPPAVPASTEELWFRLAPPERRPRRSGGTQR